MKKQINPRFMFLVYKDDIPARLESKAHTGYPH